MTVFSGVHDCISRTLNTENSTKNGGGHEAYTPMVKFTVINMVDVGPLYAAQGKVLNC